MVMALIVGLVVGFIAKLLMPGKDPGGFIITALLGVAGSMIAHFIGARTGMYTEGEAPGWIASILGAMVLLLGYRLITRKRTTLPH